MAYNILFIGQYGMLEIEDVSKDLFIHPFSIFSEFEKFGLGLHNKRLIR